MIKSETYVLGHPVHVHVTPGHYARRFGRFRQISWFFFSNIASALPKLWSLSFMTKRLAYMLTAYN